MRTLTIGAVNLDSASGFFEALKGHGFHAELLVEYGHTYQVRVRLDGSKHDINRVLNMLQEHVTARAAGAERLEMDGRSLTMQPVPEAGGSS